VPEHALNAYLTTYYRAVKRHLDEQGALLVTWFENILEIAPANGKNGQH
jgi:hypothetical protein